MSARGGSATRHWRNQRMTSIALLPLGGWFLFALLAQPDLAHTTVTAWLSKPLQTLLAALFGGAMLWHSLQGLQVVFEDYVGGRLLGVAIWSARIVHAAATLALAWAIWVIAAGGGT